MLRMNVVRVACILAAVGCGGDDTKDSGTSAADAATYANACIDLAGDWTIANHCSSALVGMQVGVTQDKCHVTTTGSFPGFTGDVETDGTFDISGSVSGTTVTCVGSATAQTITESCTSDCSVVLTR